MNILEIFTLIVSLVVPTASLVFQVLEYRRNTASSNYSITNIRNPLIIVNKNEDTSANQLTTSSFISRFIDTLVIVGFIIYFLIFYQLDFTLINNFKFDMISTVMKPFYLALKNYGMIINASSITLIIFLIFKAIIQTRNQDSNSLSMMYLSCLLIGLLMSIHFWQSISVDVFLSTTYEFDKILLIKICALFNFATQLFIFSRLLKLSLPQNYKVLNYEKSFTALKWNLVMIIGPFLFSIAINLL